jgi:ABC-2 type transport system ATP-binding protein
MDELPVSARGLVKRYGDVVALAGVDLTVERGDVYGFLGPNGAGKTTALRILLGLIRPTAGSARLFGRDPQTELPGALDGVGGFVETPAFYPYLSGRKNLELLAAFDRNGGDDRIASLLTLVDLIDRAGDRVGTYSQGMRQRLGIASALLRNPRLLILDEPTNGLDPGGMRDVRALVRRLADEGITILLSSHLLAEVEEVCTRVAIIRLGSIVYEGSLEGLRAQAAMKYRLRVTDVARAATVLGARGDVHDVIVEGEELTFSADDSAVVEVSRAIVNAGVGIAALIPEAPSLERLFFELTEAEAQEAA